MKIIKQIGMFWLTTDCGFQTSFTKVERLPHEIFLHAPAGNGLYQCRGWLTNANDISVFLTAFALAGGVL